MFNIDNKCTNSYSSRINCNKQSSINSYSHLDKTKKTIVIDLSHNYGVDLDAESIIKVHKNKAVNLKVEQF